MDLNPFKKQLHPSITSSREVGEVRALLLERLARHRDDLERVQDETHTSLLRGRIREVKELLAQIAPATAPTPDAAVGFVGIEPVFSQPITDGPHY